MPYEHSNQTFIFLVCQGSPTNNVSPTSTPAKSAGGVPTLEPPPTEATPAAAAPAEAATEWVTTPVWDIEEM